MIIKAISGEAATLEALFRAQNNTPILPAPGSPASLAGTIAYVKDATAPSYNATLAGGGSVKTLALCNGTNWTAH